MEFRLRHAISAWDAEVTEESIRLIETGVPPYDAMERARNIVSRRRARQASQKERGHHDGSDTTPAV